MAGPLRLATFKEVGSLSRNSCHMNSLIFKGKHAFQSPATACCAVPRHNLRYKELTENLPELVSAQLTVSGSPERVIGLIRCSKAARLDCSNPFSSRLN